MTQPLSVNESEEPEPASLRFRFDSETVEQFAARYASDVSRGGIFVHSRQPFAIGTQLRLDLQLLNGTPLIVGEGTVHWTREPDPNKPAQVPGMGIRFSKLSARSQQVLEMVLTQRTGRQRTGLFSTMTETVSVEESTRILTTSNSKSKLPFNVFPGSKPYDPKKISDDRELLATSGREEATPLVGVSAATLADARPGKDEPGSKTPASTAPAAEIGGGAAHASGGVNPPSLALIKPGVAQIKETDNVTESGRVAATLHRSSSGIAPLPTPATTLTTQELSAPSGSGLRQPVIDSGPIQSVKAPKGNKMIIGAAALLAVTLTIFATTRKETVRPDDTTTAARVTATTGTSARTINTERSVQPAIPSPAGTAPTETAPEANAAPSVEPETVAPSSGGQGSAPSSVADRRAPKGKPAPAHRPEVQLAGRPSSAPSERPPVAEAPARVEAPAPLPTPTPAPAVVVHEAPPAPRGAVSTAPPPVASIAHKLRMTSIPSEADVELDGKPIGRTPLFGVEIDVSHPRALVVHKDGYAPFKQTISSSSEWSMRSTENTATLRVSALMKKL